MKRSSLYVLALLLAAVVPSLHAQSQPARSADLAASDIHADWHQAVVASGLDIDRPILLEPIATQEGITEYRLESVATGEIAFARVRVPVVPTGGEPEAVERGREVAERGTAPYTDYNIDNSSRCTVTLYQNGTFGFPSFRVNVDLNTYRDVLYGNNSALNDSVSSISSGCTAVYLFEHKNWGGTAYYHPAHTSTASVGSFNDKASSMWHVIP